MKNRNSVEAVYDLVTSPFYKYVTALIVCFQVLLIILFTIKRFEVDQFIFSVCNFMVTFIFLIEYFLRLFAAPAFYRDKTPFRARREYVFSFTGLIDLLCMLPFLVYYVVHLDLSPGVFDFARAILILKVARYTTGFKLVIEAFEQVRRQIYTVLVISSIFLVFASLMMYYLEKDAQPERFASVGEGFWLEIITFTTVGYGDVYPVTPWGKVLGACSAIVGIFMIALPSGILSSAFMSQIQKEKPKNEDVKEVD